MENLPTPSPTIQHRPLTKVEKDLVAMTIAYQANPNKLAEIVVTIAEGEDASLLAKDLLEHLARQYQTKSKRAMRRGLDRAATLNLQRSKALYQASLQIFG